MSVQQLKTTKQFTFGTAYYHAGDGQGDCVVLKVDYANNTFMLVPRTGAQPNKTFREELGNFAQDLLKRKHGVNFAGRLLRHPSANSQQ